MLVKQSRSINNHKTHTHTQTHTHTDTHTHRHTHTHQRTHTHTPARNDNLVCVKARSNTYVNTRHTASCYDNSTTTIISITT